MNIISTIMFPSLIFASPICSDWFTQLKIPKDKACSSKCMTATVDMSSFDCHDECDKLCADDQISYSLLRVYGLTDKEIQICDKSPILCIKSYLDSLKAEKSCLTIFPASRTNDESDACRHFQWAIFMAKDIGEADAEKILSAHEENSREPVEERAMDLANNRLGLLVYRSLKETGLLSEKDMVESFKQNLKDGKFIILKPRYKKSGGLP